MPTLRFDVTLCGRRRARSKNLHKYYPRSRFSRFIYLFIFAPFPNRWRSCEIKPLTGFVIEFEFLLFKSAFERKNPQTALINQQRTTNYHKRVKLHFFFAMLIIEIRNLVVNHLGLLTPECRRLQFKKVHYSLDLDFYNIRIWYT